MLFKPMIKLNSNELQYIKTMLNNGVRLDSRKFFESRKVFSKTNFLPQYDANISITLGKSKLDIFLRFETISETLETDENEQSILFWPFFAQNKIICKIPSKLGLKVIIEPKVIHDDGSMLMLFHKGINLMFDNIALPGTMEKYDLEDSDNDIMIDKKKNHFLKMYFGNVSSYGLINNHYLVDPSKIEESAMDALVTVLIEKNDIFGICLFSQDGISVETLVAFLLNKKLKQ